MATLNVVIISSTRVLNGFPEVINEAQDPDAATIAPEPALNYTVL